MDTARLEATTLEPTWEGLLKEVDRLLLRGRRRVVQGILAGLAEQLTTIDKEKQVEVRGFLEWLEGHIGAKVDDLTNKTKIRDYHELEFEQFVDILKKNRRKLGANPESRSFQETLRGEFEKSVGKSGPLKRKIKLTDRLIDQIVYRLYGLTEEEIGIVEGQ